MTCGKSEKKLVFNNSPLGRNKQTHDFLKRIFIYTAFKKKQYTSKVTSRKDQIWTNKRNVKFDKRMNFRTDTIK